MVKVLLLSPLHKRTGNNTSSQRIMTYFLSAGYEVDIQDCYQYNNSEQFNEYIKKSKPVCVLSVHAYRSGLYLTDCNIPVVVVFGGTDLNEHYTCESKMNVMTKVVHKAKYLVAFSKPMHQQAKALWPDVIDRLVLQPQAVETSPDVSFCFPQHLQTHYNVHPGHVIFLLLAGLRPVKDVLYLCKAFSEWHLGDPTVHMVICGPLLDVSYGDQVERFLENLPGVHLISELPLAHAHTAIQQSFALLNSSLSEGMSSTILEAMDLEVPVIARDIAGNKAIITHQETGLLYHTPQEFIHYAKCLREDACLRERIIRNAKYYLTTNHSTEKEKETYCRIVAEIIDKRKCWTR